MSLDLKWLSEMLPLRKAISCVILGSPERSGYGALLGALVWGVVEPLPRDTYGVVAYFQRVHLIFYCIAGVLCANFKSARYYFSSRSSIPECAQKGLDGIRELRRVNAPDIDINRLSNETVGVLIQYVNSKE